MDKNRRLQALEKQAGSISGTPGIEVDMIAEAWAGRYEPAALREIIKIARTGDSTDLADELQAAYDHNQAKREVIAEVTKM
jgi:hypothetical protein